MIWKYNANYRKREKNMNEKDIVPTYYGVVLLFFFKRFLLLNVFLVKN